MINKFYAYVIIIMFVLVFIAISGILFSVMPREYYLLASIIDIGLLVIGVKAIAKISPSCDKKDLT